MMKYPWRTSKTEPDKDLGSTAGYLQVAKRLFWQLTLISIKYLISIITTNHSKDIYHSEPLRLPRFNSIHRGDSMFTFQRKNSTTLESRLENGNISYCQTTDLHSRTQTTGHNLPGQDPESRTANRGIGCIMRMKESLPGIRKIQLTELARHKSTSIRLEMPHSKSYLPNDKNPLKKNSELARHKLTSYQNP